MFFTSLFSRNKSTVEEDISERTESLLKEMGISCQNEVEEKQESNIKEVPVFSKENLQIKKKNHLAYTKFMVANMEERIGVSVKGNKVNL